MAETWHNLMFVLRKGLKPRIVASTTPRPIRWLRELLRDPKTRVTRGSTFDNAPNLSPVHIERMRTRYEGRWLGRQELFAELLEDVEGALWTHDSIDASRVDCVPCDLARVVVAIDPAVTSGEGANETGIIVVGLGVNRDAYVLEDCSCTLSPDGWARKAVEAYRRHRADGIIGEVNNGGDFVEQVLRTVDPAIPFRGVHATRGKVLRAQPIAALYEQGRVHHVGFFPELEEQMCSFVLGKYDGSPDRLDALVWAIAEFSKPEPAYEEEDDDPYAYERYLARKHGRY